MGGDTGSYGVACGEVDAQGPSIAVRQAWAGAAQVRSCDVVPEDNRLTRAAQTPQHAGIFEYHAQQGWQRVAFLTDIADDLIDLDTRARLR